MKPRIGILFLTSGWYRQVGIQSADSPLSKKVDKIADQLILMLSEYIDPVYNGIIFSETKAVSAAKIIENKHVHGLIIAPLMWCEDQILSAALNKLPILPILLCNFIPYQSLPEYVSFKKMLEGSASTAFADERLFKTCRISLSGCNGILS